MSFYRSILAALAALAIASPVFADDAMAPTPTNEAPTAMQSTAEATESAKVDLNKATAKELMKVKGLNASKARAIVAYRKKHGEFKSVDDLASVKGFKKMKPDTMKEITEQLSVD